jgi:hypothetical protein
MHLTRARTPCREVEVETWAPVLFVAYAIVAEPDLIFTAWRFTPHALPFVFNLNFLSLSVSLFNYNLMDSC